MWKSVINFSFAWEIESFIGAEFGQKISDPKTRHAHVQTGARSEADAETVD
jgi:hypothetical protein